MNGSFEEKLRNLSCEEREEWYIKRLRDAARVATCEEYRDRYLHMADCLRAGEPVQNLEQAMEYIDDRYGSAIENMNRMSESENGEWSTDATWHRKNMEALDSCEEMALRLPKNFKHITLEKIRGYRNSIEGMAGPPQAGTCHHTYSRLISELLNELEELTS